MNSGKQHGDGESFATRWSRRKRDVAQEEEAQEQQAEIAENLSANSAIEPVAETPDAAQLKAEKLAELNALTDEDMPDVDSLDDRSNFAQFMSTGVSEELRKLALRKLFQGEGYNVRDGLDEYDGDYTYFEKLDPNTITSDMKHLMEVEAEKLKQLEADALLEEEADEQAEETVLEDETQQLDDDNLEQWADESTENNDSEKTEDEIFVNKESKNIDADTTQTDEEELG